jgi:transketolase
MPLEPLVDKWKAFNFAVLEIDGHKVEQVIEALEEARNISDKPSVIVAHTVKGKGVSFMENRAQWHGIAPDDQQLAQAIAEIREGQNE